MNGHIQIIRAMAAMAVVAIHSNAEGILGVLDRPFLNFSVAMFTFLSGYLTRITIKNLSSFYKKRILKVLIPYIVWTLVYCIAYGKVDQFLKCLVTGSAAAQLYYILVYIQLVILTPFIGALIQSRYSIVGWFVTPVYILFTRYVGTFAKMSIPVGTICLAWFIYYYLGMQLGNGRIKICIKWNVLWTLYTTSIALSICEGMVWFFCFDNFDMATTQLRMTSIITSLVSCFIAYKFIKNEHSTSKNKLFDLLINVGNRSFGIYFAHLFVLSALGTLFERLNIEYMLSFPFKTILALIISYVFAFLANATLGKYSWLLGL